MHIGVIQLRGVNIGIRRLIGVEMKGCEVRNWIVGEKYMRISIDNNTATIIQASGHNKNSL